MLAGIHCRRADHYQPAVLHFLSEFTRIVYLCEVKHIKMSDKKKRVFLNDWWKQFLTGVMGTAIGVGLTFAVSNMVDNHNKAQVRRQTATMVVYDINEMIREIKEDQQWEKTLYPVAMALVSHPEKVDVISEDSLKQAVTYLMEDVTSIPEWANDTKERAFTGGMEAWQNLENTRFYDNVQKCYLRRADLFRTVQRDLVFRHPVSETLFDQFIAQISVEDLSADGSLTSEALRKLLKQVCEKPETVRYLRMYRLRNMVYNEFIDDLTRMNQENKFLMSISDEEIEAYIRKNVQKTKSATPKLVAGVWETQANELTETYRFKPDHALEITVDFVTVAEFRVEPEDRDVVLEVPVSYRMVGVWALEGDVLQTVIEPGNCEVLSVGLNLDGLTEAAREKGEEWLSAYRQQINGYLQAQSDEMRANVSFDLTGDRMFWSFQASTLTSQSETVRLQFVRKRQ